MKKPLLAILALHLSLLPCFADVLPTRRVERDAAAEKSVQARLEQLGVPSPEAARQVESLTTREVAYFARNENRLQAVTGLYWYEWLGAAGVAVFLVVMYNIAINH